MAHRGAAAGAGGGQVSESMRELLHADALPLALRQMRDGTATVEQITHEFSERRRRPLE